MANPENSVLKAFPHLPETEKRAIELILERGARLRERILGSFPTHEVGINTDRLFNFFRSKNFRICPFIFIDNESSLVKLKDEYEQAGISLFTENAEDDDWVAIYDINIDLIIVKNYNGFRTQSGVDKESWLAHEEAHASCQYGGCKLVEGEAFRSRLGFRVNMSEKISLGQFLEEGFAEYTASEYRSRYADREALEKFDKFVEGVPRNLDVMKEVDFGQDKLLMPIKYLMFNEDGDLGVDENAYSAYAFQLIIQNRPGLLTKVLQARSSTGMLAEVIKEINAIAPGLYLKLNKLQDNNDDFEKGLRMVLDAVKKSPV